jgi:hypothetical protein
MNFFIRRSSAKTLPTQTGSQPRIEFMQRFRQKINFPLHAGSTFCLKRVYLKVK